MIPAVDASTRDSFLASFGRCRATAGFLDAFYQRLLASSDEVRAKFAKTDMLRQVQMLEDTLFVVANAVQGEEGKPGAQRPARASPNATAAGTSTSARSSTTSSWSA
jgi:hypothetical protein